jgi:hypothetical protein
MEPKTPRLDPVAVLYTALSSAVTGHRVYTGVDASVDPAVSPVTVLTVPSHTPAGAYTRWSFSVDVTLMTYAASTAEAARIHAEAADALLELTEASTEDGRPVAVSGVICTLEPADLPTRAAPQWPGVMSSYNLFLRTWR